MRDKNMLVVTANRDVRAELARALVEAGHPPYHLRRRGDELDEVYRRYFAANEPTGAAAVTGQADFAARHAAAQAQEHSCPGPGRAAAPSRVQRPPRQIAGPRFRAGWRIIAAKEFADSISSYRFLGLTIVLALAGAAAVYATGGVIKSFAADASGTQSLFLILFAPPRRCRH